MQVFTKRKAGLVVGAVAQLLVLTGAAWAEPAALETAERNAHLLAQKFAEADDATSASQPKPEPGKPSVTTVAAPEKAAAVIAKPSAPIGAQSAVSERPSLDYEIDMLRRARREAATRAATATAKPGSPSPSPPSATAPSTANTATSMDAATASERKPAAAVVKQAAEAEKSAKPVVVKPPTVAVQPTENVKPSPALTTVEQTSTAVSRPAQPTRKAFAAPATSPVASSPTPPAPTPEKPTDVKAPDVIPQAKPQHVAAAPAPAATPPPASTPTPAAAPPETLEAVSPVDIASGELANVTVIVLYHDEAMDLDPVACIDADCYLSAGLRDTARKMPRADAMALASSIGATNDPCRGKSGCIFRNISVGDPQKLTMVNLSSKPSAVTTSNGESSSARAPLLSADGYSITADSTCKLIGRSLQCGQPLITPDFHAWVVPEALARQAGDSALEDAIAEGLPTLQGAAPPSADK